jgi:hypothetical protein
MDAVLHFLGLCGEPNHPPALVGLFSVVAFSLWWARIALSDLLQKWRNGNDR